jgi:hypothetical protein
MVSFVFAPIGVSFAQAPVLASPSSSQTDQSVEEQLQELMRQVIILRAQVNRLQTLLIELEHGQAFIAPCEEETNKIISRGIDWFKNAQEENGHFRYEYMPYEDRYLNDDNIVRQAGAMYALGEVLRRDTANVYDLKNAVERSAAYFKNLSRRGEYDGKKFQCVVSKKGSNTCVLGTTSLVLVGLLDLIERHPSLAEEYVEMIDDYAEYLVAMKKESTGFRNYYYVGKEAQSDKESSFSTGEALLALVRYYRFHPTDEVKQVIDDTFEYISSDEVPFDFGLYLWAMAALKDLYMIDPQEKYVSYVQDYTDWRIYGFQRRKESTHNMCAYVEGVVSAYSTLEPHATEAEKEKYLDEISYWLGKSAKLQLTEKDTNRLMYSDRKAYFLTLSNPARAIGGFLTGEREFTQRIDFTQHCLSSFVQKKVDIDGGVIVAP